MWIALGLGMLALGCCCALTTGLLIWRGVTGASSVLGLGRMEVAVQAEQVLAVHEPIHLVVNVPVGDITVQAGSGSEVRVETAKRAWAGSEAAARRVLEGIDVRVEQSGDRVQVTAAGLAEATDSGGLARSPQVDLVLTVPRRTSLEVVSNVGRVAVTGTQGDVTIKADVGEVLLAGVAPVDLLDVRSRLASIELVGGLAAGATYRAVSDVGRIAVRLPRDAAFRLEARSDIGGVEVGFEVRGRSGHESLLGTEVSGEVGAHPTARLILTSRVGDISVQPLP